MDLKKHLQTRYLSKKRKPVALAQDTHKNIRLQNNLRWKKPRGIHSKIRLNRKGHRSRPQIGFGSPADVHGLLRDGTRPILVKSLKDLLKVGPKDGIMISSTLGKRVRLEIISFAEKNKLKIINIKDPKTYQSNIVEEMKKRKASRVATTVQNKTQDKKKAKSEENKESKKEESEKESVQDPLAEKKEHDKILTSKG